MQYLYGQAPCLPVRQLVSMKNNTNPSNQDTNISVRPATPGDSDTIVKLITALAEFERLPPPDAAAQQRLLGDAFGPHPRFEIFLAEYDGQVAGYAFIFETYS